MFAHVSNGHKIELCVDDRIHTFVMAALDNLEDFVRDRIEEDYWTHKQLSHYLQRMYPSERGFSIRSLQRFCERHDTSRVSESALCQAVTDAIAKVGNK